MQFSAGPLVRKWGARVVLEVALGVAALGSLLLALAAGPLIALLGRALTGLAVGMVLVALLELISRWFRQNQFVNMMGLLLAMGGLGVFAGSTPLAYLDRLLGWRGSFLAIAAVSAGLVSCMWLLTRDTPEQMGFPPVEERPTPSAGPEEKGNFGGLGAVLSSLRFWPPAIWGFCALAVFTSMGGLWGGPYLMHVYSLSKLEAGHILSMQAVGMVLGSPLLAYLSGRRWGSRRRVLAGAGLLLVVLCSIMMLSLDRLPVISLYAWFAGLGLATIAAAPLALSIARENVSPGASALATGARNFFFLIGGAVMQPEVGWILDVHGGSGVYTGAHFDWSFKLYWAMPRVKTPPQTGTSCE